MRVPSAMLAHPFAVSTTTLENCPSMADPGPQGAASDAGLKRRSTGGVSEFS